MSKKDSDHRKAREDEAGSDLEEPDFLSLLSHQLKTPVTSLKLKLQLCRRFLEDPSPEEFAQFSRLLSGAEQDVGRITEIITETCERKGRKESV